MKSMMIIRSIEDVEAISYGEGVSKRVVIGEKRGAELCYEGF